MKADNKRKDLDRASLAVDCDAGMCKADIAKKYGVSQPTVTRNLKQYGLVAGNGQNSASTRMAISRSLSKRWEDPAYKDAIVANRRTDAYRSARRDKSKELWRDPSFRSKTSDANRKAWINPTLRERAALNTIKQFNKPLARQNASAMAKEQWQNPEYRAKMSNIKSSAEIRSKISVAIKLAWKDPEYLAKSINNIRTRWQNSDYRTKMAGVLANQPRSLTKPHLKVCELLTSLGVAFTVEKAIGPWVFDIFVESANLLIEVQGDYWHSLPKAERNDLAKSTYVAQHFPQYQLRYIWEHECLTEGSVLAKLKYWLGLDKVEQVDYEFSQLKVNQVADTKVADEFLYNWHYQHHGRHGFDVGAYLDTGAGPELICLARWTSPSRSEIATSLGYTQKQVLELARLVVHPKYQKKNLLSWFLARCEKMLRARRPDVTCLVSFADSTYNHTGAVYKASNWTLNRVVEPNYWYVDSAGWVMHKKTLWNHARSLKMTEADYAEKNGFTKVWGKEKYKFIKELK